MKQKLKYLKLFEELTQRDIPYSIVDDNGKLHIKFPKSVKSINTKFNQLTTEVTGDLLIQYNTELQSVTGFNQLQSVGEELWIDGNTDLKTVPGFDQLQSVGGDLAITDNTVLQSVTGFVQLREIRSILAIDGNTALHTVTGFDNLQSVGDYLWINNNPNLVTMSIPSTMIRSMNYEDWGIQFEDEYKFYSPEKFINSELVIQDCIDKFNPGLHSDVVVTQILENINIWGTPETQATIINHLLSKGNYLNLIPEHLKHLVEDTYKHLYHSDFNNTGAKSVAKVATGVTYGLF